MGTKSLLLVGLMLLAAMPALPLAEAQDPPVRSSVSISIPDPGTPVVPGRIHVYSYRVTYTWGMGAASNEPIRLAVSLIEQPDWANVTFTPDRWTVDLSPPANALQNGSRVFQGTLNVTAHELAPAFQRRNVSLQVEATGGGNVAAPPNQKSTLPIQPDFLGALVVEADAAVLKGGRAHTIPVRVANHGNGPVDVTFAVSSLLANARVTAPAAIRLGSPAVPAGEPSEATVHVHLEVPWTQSLNGTITVTGTGISIDNSQKPPAVGEVEIAVASASAVPGPGALLILAGVAAAAVLRRRG